MTWIIRRFVLASQLPEQDMECCFVFLFFFFFYSRIHLIAVSGGLLRVHILNTNIYFDNEERDKRNQTCQCPPHGVEQPNSNLFYKARPNDK